MKKRAYLLFLFLSFAAAAQGSTERVLIMKEIRNGAVCETCLVTNAGNISDYGDAISILTPNHDNQFLYKDPLLTETFSTLPHFRLYLAVGRFSLDFYPFAKLFPDKVKKKGPNVDFKDVQFSILVNGKLKTDWTDITSLKTDPEFFVGHADLDSVGTEFKSISAAPVEHYHAGMFELRINETLVIEFRNKHTLVQMPRLTITRVRAVPDRFDFVEFSSTKGLEEILNTEAGRRRPEPEKQTSTFEMAPGNSAFLRFANDEQYYFFGRIPRHSGIEYAIDQPANWKTLSGDGDAKFTNGYTYIYLHNPAQGKTIKVFLRYKYQPESIHEVTVHVRLMPGNGQWLGYLFLLGALVVLGIAVIFVQKQRHKRQLARLNRNKSEIENQLQLLSGQLNPHFLFNSLNAVQSLIRQNDQEAANQYITEVATFMRTIMDSGRKELVSLGEEIAIEEQYIALEQKRRAFSYSLRIECNYDLSSIDFPPLLLQPIIENSIRHGLTDAVHDPTLTLTVRCEASDLILTVTDNGAGFDPSVKSRGHGLSLTEKRIALLNEKLPSMQIVLQTKSGQRNGTITEIRLLKWLS